MALVLVPSGVAAFIAWARQQADLVAIQSTRVGTILSGTLPATRVTLIDGSPEVSGEFNAAHPTIEIEAWAATPDAADTLMRTYIAALPSMKGGTWAGAYVSGVDVNLGPLMSDDPDTGEFRQLMDVVLDIHNP